MLYGLFKNVSNEIVGRASIVNEDKLPTKEGCTLEIVTKQAFDDAVIIEDPIYLSDELIAWALSQVFAEALIPHMAAFLDFANKASIVSKDNFLTYAAAVGLSETANLIVAKAVELGADLGGE